MYVSNYPDLIDSYYFLMSFWIYYNYNAERIPIKGRLPVFLVQRYTCVSRCLKYYQMLRKATEWQISAQEEMVIYNII